MKNNECMICGKILQTGEAQICQSCVVFIEWKYGSLEEFQTERNKALKAEGKAK